MTRGCKSSREAMLPAHRGAAARPTCCQGSTTTPQCLQHLGIMEEFYGLLWEQVTEVLCGSFRRSSHT